MITKLVVKNFVGLPDGEYNFGLINRITGRNGSGKTSLAKAMMFAATGLDMTLASAGGAYVKDVAIQMQADLHIDSKVLSTKRNKAARVVTLDKMPVTDEFLARHFNMPLIALGCMFLPESFFHLSTQKRRDLFMQITPEQDLKAIFCSMTDDINPDVIDWKLSPKKLQENWTRMRIDIEKDLAKVTGQYDELIRNTNNDNVVIDVTEKQQALATLQYEINLLTAQRCELTKQAQDFAKYQYQYDVWKTNSAKINDVIAENKRRELLRAKLVDLTQYDAAKQAIMEDNAQVQATIKTIKERGELLNKKLKDAQKIPDNCPTCGRAWDCEKPNTLDIEDEIKVLREEYVYQTSILADVTEKYKSIVDTIKTATASNTSLGDTAPLAIPDVVPEPQTIIAPDAKLADDLQKKLSDLLEKQSEIKHLLTQAEAINKRVATQNSRLLELKKDMATITANLTNTIFIEKALHPKTGIWAEALKRKLASVKIEGFKFEFTETLQNGDEKETFNVVREKDGVPCELLSSGEKIKFCLALSQLIANLTNTPFKSVFLEHTDLMDAVPNLAGFQIFAERVSKTDLTIEVIK